jgi:hypothetical protein
MRSLMAGAVLLSLWSGLNLLVAAAVTAVTLSGGEPPALSLVFGPDAPRDLDAKALAVINAQAALANPCIVALCLLVSAITWTSLVARRRWSFWALVVALVPLQAFGFASDAFLGHKNLIANVASSALLFAGLALSGYALFRGAASSKA